MKYMFCVYCHLQICGTCNKKICPNFYTFIFCFNNFVEAKIKSFMKSLKFELKFDTSMESLNIHKTQKHQLLVRIILNCVQVAYDGDICLIPEHIAVTQSWSLRFMEANFGLSSKSGTFAANHIFGLHISANVVMSYSLLKFLTMNLLELICEIKLWEQNESQYSHNITFRSIYI